MSLAGAICDRKLSNGLATGEKQLILSKRSRRDIVAPTGCKIFPSNIILFQSECGQWTWTLWSPLSRNFCRLRDDIDDDGQLDSIALKRDRIQLPVVVCRRYHLEVCKNCMTKATRESPFTVHTLDGTEHTQRQILMKIYYRQKILNRCLKFSLSPK